MRRRDVGVIMKSCVAALSAAVVLTAMPAQVNAAPTKSVTVSTQKSLNAALKNSKVGTITIKTSKDIKISIPKGKFTSKSVVMNASKASLTNNGTLKGMNIKSAKIVTEKADNNKINITDKGLRLIVAKGADNSKVSIGTKDAKVTVVADGKVASVSVNKKALVAVIGKTTKPVSVTSTVAGTGLILASKANVALKNSTNVDVRKGADLGTVTAYNNASLKVAKGAKIATLNSTGDKASVKLATNGTVEKVVLKKKATVTITGEPTKKVAVTNNASGSLVKLGVKADVKATQPTTVNAYKGSEIGKVTATKALVLNVGSGAKVDTVLASKDVEVNANKGSEVGTVTGSMDVEVNVAVGAKVDTVKSQGEDAKVTVSANGTVGDVVIDAKADVKVAGTTTTPVNVTSNAADSVVSVSAASKITLNESATVNVAEGAKVESLTAAKDVAVTVDAKAEVAEVVVKGEDAKVDVTANGTVGAVTVDAKAEVSIKGETDSSVVVNANVESAKINTEVKTEVNANANVDITLGAGAEGSKVVAAKDVNASVKNETKENVTVTDSTGKDTTVGSGSTGDTKPVTTPAPYYPPVITPPTTTQKTVLTAEVIFGTGSKNLQIFFKDGDKYLTAEEIKALGDTRLDEIVNGFRVEDNNNRLYLTTPSVNDTWTIHTAHDNYTGDENNKHSNCAVAINPKGYDVFEAWQWQGTKTSGDIYSGSQGVKEDTGYLKIHLGADDWTGFSEDFVANKNVEIEYTSKNYDITIMNYGGSIRKKIPEIKLQILKQTVVYDGNSIDIGSDFSVTVDGKSVIKNGDDSYSIDGINGLKVGFKYIKVLGKEEKDELHGLPTDVGSYKLTVYVEENDEYNDLRTDFDNVITIVKDNLDAEVIFGKESKNLQMLFKRGGAYLTVQEINSLKLSEIVNALSVTDTGKQLVLKNHTDGEKWTIHQVGSANGTTTHTCGAWNQDGTGMEPDCRQIIPELGYGVYPTSAWDGLSSGGVLTNKAPNAGFLKIHLGDNNASDSAWDGFSEDFNAKTNVTINFSSTNYEITVKNFGGAKRPMPNIAS